MVSMPGRCSASDRGVASVFVPVRQFSQIPTQPQWINQSTIKFAGKYRQIPEQRIQQLDKLAAAGYISADEYKAKKQSIIDSM